jgi:hypothetical protein
MSGSFWDLITSKSGFIAVGSAAVATGTVVYFGSPFIIGNAGGTIIVPLIGSVEANLGLALTAGLATFASEGLFRLTLPLVPSIPGSQFLMGSERTILGPLLTGASMYGIMKVFSSNSANTIGFMSMLALGGTANFIGGSLAQAWQPWLKSVLGG